MARLAANLPPQPGVRGRGVCLLPLPREVILAAMCVNEEKAV